MSNVLKEEKKQQVLALGRLGWPLRKIQQATRIRRETASQYLKAAGIAVRLPGGWGRRAAKPANEVITDFGAEKAATAVKEWAEASRGKDGDEAALENASALASGVSHFSTAPATAKTTSKPARRSRSLGSDSLPCSIYRTPSCKIFQITRQRRWAIAQM
jgi:hypothetical protein